MAFEKQKYRLGGKKPRVAFLMRGFFPVLFFCQKCNKATRGFFPVLFFCQKCNKATRGFFPIMKLFKKLKKKIILKRKCI
jgi:hypothetical protein